MDIFTFLSKFRFSLIFGELRYSNLPVLTVAYYIYFVKNKKLTKGDE